MRRGIPQITGSVPTPGLTHGAAMIDSVVCHPAGWDSPVTVRGCRDLLDWIRSRREPAAVRGERVGARTGGLGQALTARGVAMVDADQPSRATWQHKGGAGPTTDAVTAEAAATTVFAMLAADREPASQHGVVKAAMRVPGIARANAARARAQRTNQPRDLLVSAPVMLRREQFPELHRAELMRMPARLRLRGTVTITRSRLLTAPQAPLPRFGRCSQTMDAEIAVLEADAGPLLRRAASTLLELLRVGAQTVGRRRCRPRSG